MSGWALQKAVYQALATDANLQAFLGDPPNLFDYVPENPAFPYVTLGEAESADWSTSSETGTEYRLTLHAWSRQRSSREVSGIVDALRTVLHDAQLTLEAGTLVNLRFVTGQILRDPDGRTRHGVARFRAVWEP